MEERRYRHQCYQLCAPGRVTTYVVDAEQYAQQELARLAPFCQCQLCVTDAWFGCACCYGCLQSDRIGDGVVARTRDYVLRNPTAAPNRSTVWAPRAFALLVLLFVALFVLYCWSAVRPSLDL